MHIVAGCRLTYVVTHHRSTATGSSFAAYSVEMLYAPIQTWHAGADPAAEDTGTALTVTFTTAGSCIPALNPARAAPHEDLRFHPRPLRLGTARN